MPESPVPMFPSPPPSGARRDARWWNTTRAAPIAAALLAGALGLTSLAPAGAAGAGSSAPATTASALAPGAGVGDALAVLPPSSLSTVLAGAVPALPVGTVLQLPATVLRDLAGPLKLAPAVLSALPAEELLALVTPILAALPTATVVGLVKSVLSALPLASVLGLLVSVVPGGAGSLPGAGPTHAALPTTTTTARPTPMATLAPLQAAAAPARAQAPGAVGLRCTAARSAVEAAGLVLPAYFDYRCPGSTELFVGGRQHWGTTCSWASLCPGSSYVAINPALIGPSDARLRYVVAHETCHALDSQGGRPMSEPKADACAAAHGFPRV